MVSALPNHIKRHEFKAPGQASKERGAGGAAGIVRLRLDPSTIIAVIEECAQAASALLVGSSV